MTSTDYMLKKMDREKSVGKDKADQSDVENKSNKMRPVAVINPDSEPSLEYVLKNCISNKKDEKLFPGS